MLNFARINKGVILPTKEDENAGYDIYPYFEEDTLAIAPHQTVMIPTGLYSAFDKDYVMILKERGSTGTIGLAQRCGVIDSGFRGEWFIPITNTTNELVVIDKSIDKVVRNWGTVYYPYSKAICQAVLVPVPSVETAEISLEELKNIESKRGDGMLGSSEK